MALTFGAVNTDRAVVAGATPNNTLTEQTWVVRAYPTTLTTAKRMATKCSLADGSSRTILRLNGTGGNIEAFVTGNALNGQAISSGTELASTGKWYTVAFTSSDAGDKKPHLYVGAEDGELAEVASYGTQTAYDALRGDETGSVVWGNGRPGVDTTAFEGRLADCMLFNVILTLDELKAIHNGRIDPRAVVSNRLWGNVSPEPDLSKNAATATVTGATKADHAPMSKWRPRSRLARLSRSAAVTGTATAGITEVDVRAGGKTIILTLTGDTWVPA